MTKFITINCLDMFMGQESLKPGMKLKLLKELDNPYDDEAIKVIDDKSLQYGYVANSIHTVVRGTHSAGYILHDLDYMNTCIIMFIAKKFAIASLEETKTRKTK